MKPKQPTKKKEEPEIKREHRLWALCNGKEMTPEAFERNVGVSFKKFTNQNANRKFYLAAWMNYLKSKRNQRSEKLRCGCICVREAKLSPNGVSGSARVPVRLWYCAVHGNRFVHLPKSTYDL